MSYRIEPNESVREALVRVAREQLDTGLHDALPVAADVGRG
jgi:hypothetical protein